MSLSDSAARRLRDNLARVQQQIDAACRRAGRAREEVRLVAVTKYVGPNVIAALLSAGQFDLGESRVTQLVERATTLDSTPCGIDDPPRAARWHLIGHLQRNKVKPLLSRCRIVHSVDSLRLAQEINGRALATPGGVDVLLEVNVSGESSKAGVGPDDLPMLVEQVAELRRLRLCGLMTMAPLHPDPQRARPHFAQLRGLLEVLHARRLVGDACRHLSMGMSQDYAVAIEEGATLVRIGSVLFEGLGDEVLRPTDDSETDSRDTR